MDAITTPEQKTAAVEIKNYVNRFSVLMLAALILSTASIAIGSLLMGNVIASVIDGAEPNTLMLIVGGILFVSPTRFIFASIFKKMSANVGAAMKAGNYTTASISGGSAGVNIAAVLLTTAITFATFAFAFVGGIIALITMLVNNEVTVTALTIVIFASRTLLTPRTPKENKA